MAGLVHDIGLLVYDYLVPEQFNQFLITTDFHNSDQPLETLETNIFGISHSELGAAYLKEWWPVSEKVVEAVKAHGELGLEKDQVPGLTRLVSTAN